VLEAPPEPEPFEEPQPAIPPTSSIKETTKTSTRFIALSYGVRLRFAPVGWASIYWLNSEPRYEKASVIRRHSATKEAQFGPAGVPRIA
jgi:hypothetical protein